MTKSSIVDADRGEQRELPLVAVAPVIPTQSSVVRENVSDTVRLRFEDSGVAGIQDETEDEAK